MSSNGRLTASSGEVKAVLLLVDSERLCQSRRGRGDLSQAAQRECQRHSFVNGQQCVFYDRRLRGGVCVCSPALQLEGFPFSTKRAKGEQMLRGRRGDAVKITVVELEAVINQEVLGACRLWWIPVWTRHRLCW